MTFKFKKIAGLLMGAMAAFTISVNASAAKTKLLMFLNIKEASIGARPPSN